eukprot:3138705-Ditylum_brightwellii.AAC.1
MAPIPMVNNFIQPAQPTVPGGYINIFLYYPPQMTMGMSTNTYYQTGQPLTLSVSNNIYYPPTFNGASSRYSIPNGVSYPVTGVACHPSLAGKG